jgi:hypothetical protein
MAIKDNKLKDLTPLEVTFFQGESPTGAKLEGMMAQLRVALEYIEATIGDAFGEDPKFNTWTSSFARDLGDRSLISPVVAPDYTEFNYNQALIVGKVEHELDLVPVGDLSTMISSSLDSAVVEGQWKNTVEELEIPGDWTILSGYIENGREKRSRKLVTHSPAEGGSLIFAEMTSGRGSALESSSENTLPNTAQADNGGPYLDISLADALTNTYLVTLPLREKMYDKTGQIIDFSASNSASAAGVNSQYVLPPFFFGASGLDLDSDESGGGPKTFPKNLVRLYDWNDKKEVGGILRIQASTVSAARTYQFLLQMQSDVILDTATGAYLLAVPGNTIADQLQALAHSVYNDSGVGSDMKRLVSHKSLLDNRTGSLNYGNRSEYYGPSNIDNNDHSMYLHRNGFTDLDVGAGANVMRGDLIIGNTDLGPLDTIHEHYNVLDDSFKLVFGNILNGGSLSYDKIATHSIDHSYGGLPLTWIDNTLLIQGSVQDGNPALRHVLINGDLRTNGDVVLGENKNSAIYIQGKGYVNNTLTFIPSDISETVGEEGETWYDPIQQELATHNGTDFVYASSRSGYTVTVGDGINSFGKYNGTGIATFTSALTDVAAGGTIKVLDGTYNVLTNSISLPQNASLVGSGPKTIIEGTNLPVLLTGDNSSVSNLKIKNAAQAVTVTGSYCTADNLDIHNCIVGIKADNTSLNSVIGSSITYETVEQTIASSSSTTYVAEAVNTRLFGTNRNGCVDYTDKTKAMDEFIIAQAPAVLDYNPAAASSIGSGTLYISGDGIVESAKYLPVDPNLGIGGHICYRSTVVGGVINAGVKTYDANFNLLSTKPFLLNGVAGNTNALTDNFIHNMIQGIGAGNTAFAVNARYIKLYISVSGNPGGIEFDNFDIHNMTYARAATWG